MKDSKPFYRRQRSINGASAEEETIGFKGFGLYSGFFCIYLLLQGNRLLYQMMLYQI